MRRIHKGEEPSSLAQHRTRQDLVPTFDNYQGKDEARDCATKEQRDICAFCQGRTAFKKTPIKLAHVVPQADPVDGAGLQLTWTNIVSSCDGGESRKRPRLLHCDSKQGSTRLHVALDPVQFVNGSLSYDEYGGVYSSDPAVQHQINEVLALTIPRLLEGRVKALLELQEDLKQSRDWESRRQDLLVLLDPARTRGVPLPEYADFLRWHLLQGFLAAPSTPS